MQGWGHWARCSKQKEDAKQQCSLQHFCLCHLFSATLFTPSRAGSFMCRAVSLTPARATRAGVASQRLCSFSLL